LDVERGEPDQLKAVIERALPSVEFSCGISNRFSSLWDNSIAYVQALMAVELAGRLKASDDPQHCHFCQFSDYWIHHLLLTGIKADPVVYKNSILFYSLDQLREYEDAHRTIRCIAARLFGKRTKATVVSALQHMHRNTVLNHIGKIANVLGVSLTIRCTP
jgi:hypothetical protein